MNEPFIYTVFDESTWCTLSEACQLCKVKDHLVKEMIQEGLLTPAGSSVQEWRFGAQELKRIQITIRLQRDLRVNLPGAALALDLLEELDQLRNLAKKLDISE
jgi:chaperone modulatory protein CbpM